MTVIKKEMADDLKLVRNELKQVLSDVKSRKTSLRRANTIIYACSNITRTVVTEIYLSQYKEETVDITDIQKNLNK